MLKVKCWNPSNEPHSHDVFALSHGKNAGKPLSHPCPNCFVIRAKDSEEKSLLLSVLTALWLGQRFTRYIGGSVIPFIRLREFKNVLTEGLTQAHGDPEKLLQVSAKIEAVLELEERLKKQLQLCKSLKVATAQELLKIR